MTRLRAMSSITINIINGGANPELIIAGIPVTIKPSGAAYTIQAGVAVKIQARNNTTGLSAESTITVPENERRTVDLFLK
jgi:serine/threonine-protein kinase